MLEAALIERAAYRDMFVTGGTLHTMEAERVSNLDKAQENARLFAEEVMSLVPMKLAKAKTAKADGAKAKATKAPKTESAKQRKAA